MHPIFSIEISTYVPKVVGGGLLKLRLFSEQVTFFVENFHPLLSGLVTPTWRVRTAILHKIPVLPGNPQDFPGEQAYYEI